MPPPAPEMKHSGQGSVECLQWGRSAGGRVDTRTALLSGGTGSRALQADMQPAG